MQLLQTSDGNKPSWAHGYDVAVLKTYAQIFSNSYKFHVFGAFGLPKERDIAAAASEGRLYTYGKSREQPLAIAIARRFKVGSSQSDFTGRTISMLAGDWFVSAFVARSLEGGEALLREFTGRVWIEVFAEDNIAVSLVRGRGALYGFTKITAGSEIKSVYTLGMTQLSDVSAFDHVSLKAVRKGLVSATECGAVVRELKKAEQLWAQHYSNYNKRKSWTAFALRGFDPEDPMFIIKPSEMSKGWQTENPHRRNARCDFTPAWDMFPTAHKILSRIPADPTAYERIRFMRLAASTGELSRHADITDREAGTAPGRIMRLHIPIVTNSDVQFMSWDANGGLYEMNLERGGLYYLDIRKPHAVVNHGGNDRIHLVADVISSKELQRYVFLTSFMG